jgi:hypothetical protein
MEGRWEVVHLLAEGARGEHLGDEVDVASRDVDPGGVELHDVAVLERLEEVDLAVEPLQVLGALQEVMQLHLVPGHVHPLELVERSVPASTMSAPRVSGKQSEASQLLGNSAGSYTVLDAPLPRTSLNCKTEQRSRQTGQRIGKQTDRETAVVDEPWRRRWRYRTLPYRPVGSTSAYSEHSAAAVVAPIVLPSLLPASSPLPQSVYRRGKLANETSAPTRHGLSC